MRITRLYCSQFAGLRGVDMTFEPGLNVLIGRNESGKSTLVSLLARTFFQPSRMDARRDKAFMASCFPAEFRDGRPVGDAINGAVAFETDSGSYALLKKWKKGKKEEGIAKLRTPSGDELTTASAVDVELRRELVYGEGVFSEILLSSQAVGGAALRTLLESPGESRSGREMAVIVTQAFVESGSETSLHALESAIKEKIAALEGKHWDAERGAPEHRNTEAQWQQGIGKVLKDYYALEDAKNEIACAKRLEETANRALAALGESEAAYSKAVREAEAFQEVASRLSNLKWRREKMENLRESLKTEERAKAEWPELEDGLRKAEALREELRRREILDRFERVERLNAAIAGFDEILKDAPSLEDVEAVRDAEDRIRSLERQLGGMKLSAQVRMENGHSMEVKSVRTGEKLDAGSGAFPIDEAAVLSIPGVMWMFLSPTGVDAEEISAQLDELRGGRDEILQRYQVSSLDELRSREDECSRARRERERAETQRDDELRGTAYEVLKEGKEAVSDEPRPAEDIDEDILAICGGASLDAFITRAETLIEKHVRDFVSQKALAERVASTRMELDTLESQAVDDEDISEKYREIEDPEKHLKRLQDAVNARQADRDEALQEKSAAMNCWEAAIPDYDLTEKQRAAERRFSETNAELKRWKHILQVFEDVKGQSLSDPMRELADRFARYLGLIAGNRLSSALSDDNGLSVSLYGGERILDYGKLSEGTKDTVALAFRLAVIDHLYPNGGGVAVFDDSLTDMDAPRMERACDLIREFAKRHQVIFMTCREEYAQRLGGNLIRFGA